MPITTASPGAPVFPRASSSEKAARPGYVYVLSNPSMPGLVKIGRTERDPETRRVELSKATGVPTPFRLEYSQFFEDCHLAEKAVHNDLQRLGQRANDGREFFRVTVVQAVGVLKRLAALERGDTVEALGTTGPSRGARDAAKDLVDQGVRLLFGLDGTMRDVPQASHYFEQAASLGSPRGAYYAGRASQDLLRNAAPKLRPALLQKAQRHYQTAMAHPSDSSRVPAAGWAAKLFWTNKQYKTGNEAWATFVERAAALDTLTNDVMTLLLEQVEWCVPHRKAWRNAALLKHRDALLAFAKPDHHAQAVRVLPRLGQPWWKHPMFFALDVFQWAPFAFTGLALAAALYALDMGWWWVLVLLGSGIVGWVEHRLKHPKQARAQARTYPRSQGGRNRRPARRR